MTANDSVQKIVDGAATNSHDFSGVYKGIVQLQQKDRDPKQLKADMTAVNDQLHKQGLLTGLEITGADNQGHFLATRDGKQVSVVAANTADVFQAEGGSHSWFQSVENVASEVGKGAWNELTHHPDHVIEAAAAGLVIGTAAVFVAPVVATVAGIAGAAFAAGEIAYHLPGWVHDAKVVANPQLYSNNEVAKADKGAQAFGGGAVDVTAGVLGGIAGGYLGTSIKTALVARAAAQAVEADAAADTTAHAHMQQGNIANTSGQIGDPSQGHAAIVQPLDHSHTAAALSTGDPSQGTETTAGSAGSEAPKPIKLSPAEVTKTASPVAADAVTALTPEQLALKQSVAQNQGIFQAANAEGDGVVSAQKQAYNVMFKKILSPGTVQTLENRAGEPVSPGQWLAIRLNADGTPVMEDGITNQWPVTPKTILKAYNTTAEQLETVNELIAGTKTGGPPVHMVQLDRDITIKTSWGDMVGKVGDWLANYDYDTATGTAGKDYAIVSKTSWDQTYQAVAKPGS